jgi:predicted phosphodiesterase
MRTDKHALPIFVLASLLAIGGVTPACTTASGDGGALREIAQTPPVAPAARPNAITLPTQANSIKFAVIGDGGTGDSNQTRVAQRLAEARQKFPFEFVIMLGDNLYGAESAADYRRKFEIPYKPILDAGVKFYASLGNHDSPNQRMYKLFNMGGKRFYSFKPKDGARFFALDSNYMDREQLQWLEKELAASGSEWKVPYFHHPIYSSGSRHGSDKALRDQLEPLFIKYGVDVVFAGHEHFYERLKPQKGIYYFISGGASKLRRGDLGGQYTEKGFDQGRSFMIVEVFGEEMHFQVISDEGRTVDAGTLKRRPVENAPAQAAPVAPPAKPVPSADKPPARPSTLR